MSGIRPTLQAPAARRARGFPTLAGGADARMDRAAGGQRRNDGFTKALRRHGKFIARS